MDQSQTNELINNLPGLILAIQKMLDKQEKNFGCFLVKKEGDFTSLDIPAFPSFKLYQNPRTHVYKGYWQTSDILPDIKDRKNKPQIQVKKKQNSVKIKQQGLTESQNIKLIEKQQHLESSESNTFTSIQQQQGLTESANRNSAAQQPYLEVTDSQSVILVKKQRIYEVIYQYNPNPEIRLVSQIIAIAIKEKIEASISSVPENEIMPLVLVSENFNN